MDKYNKTYIISEKDAAKYYFSLNKQIQLSIKKNLKSKKCQYKPYLQLALFHIIKNCQITDFAKINKLIYRYLILILYMSFQTSINITILEFDALLKDDLDVSKLDEDINTTENYGKIEKEWINIFNCAKYNNQFSLDNEKFKIELTRRNASLTTEEKDEYKKIYGDIEHKLFRQQDFFNSDFPLVRKLNPDYKNVFYMCELIAETLAIKDNDIYDFEFSFDDTLLKGFVKENRESAKKTIGCILYDAINQNATQPNSYIKTRSSYYYVYLNKDNYHGSFDEIRFIQEDLAKGNITILYSLISDDINFKINNIEYLLTRNGIIKKQ